MQFYTILCMSLRQYFLCLAWSLFIDNLLISFNLCHLCHFLIDWHLILALKTAGEPLTHSPRWGWQSGVLWAARMSLPQIAFGAVQLRHRSRARCWSLASRRAILWGCFVWWRASPTPRRCPGLWRSRVVCQGWVWWKRNLLRKTSPHRVSTIHSKRHQGY